MVLRPLTKAAQCKHDEGGRDQGHDRDEWRTVQAERRENGRHEQRPDRVAEAATHGEHAHVGSDAAAGGETGPARAFGMVGGRPDAADHGRDERGRVAHGPAHGGDAERGQQEPGGQKPAAAALVAVGAGQRLYERGRQARNEREHADRAIAVVTFEGEERRQRQQRARAQVGTAVTER
jgi:hypothetical protein